MQEVGVEDKIRPGVELLAMLDKMERWDPFLTTNDSGYPLVMDLSGLDREQAAQVLLQALVHQMIATAP